MREGRRSNSKRKLVASESLRDCQPVRTPSRRTEPKPLPLLTSNLSYSAYLRYQDVGTKDIPKTSTKRRPPGRNSRLQRKESERYKDENVVVVNDNVVKHSGDENKRHKSANNLNPFHHDFNKVIENPFLRAQEMSLSTELTEVTDDLPDTVSESSLSVSMWEVGPLFCNQMKLKGTKKLPCSAKIHFPQYLQNIDSCGGDPRGDRQHRHRGHLRLGRGLRPLPQNEGRTTNLAN